MATTRNFVCDLLLIDIILKQDESKDALCMLALAIELQPDSPLHSFCTSSQMGGADPSNRPRSSPALSPISYHTRARVSATHSNSTISDEITNTPLYAQLKEGDLNRLNSYNAKKSLLDSPMRGFYMIGTPALADLNTTAVVDPDTTTVPLTQTPAWAEVPIVLTPTVMTVTDGEADGTADGPSTGRGDDNNNRKGDGIASRAPSEGEGGDDDTLLTDMHA